MGVYLFRIPLILNERHILCSLTLGFLFCFDCCWLAAAGVPHHFVGCNHPWEPFDIIQFKSAAVPLVGLPTTNLPLPFARPDGPVALI